MAQKKQVPLSESFNHLKKSLDYLNIQQSTTTAPILYPSVNAGEDRPKPESPPSQSGNQPQGESSQGKGE